MRPLLFALLLSSVAANAQNDSCHYSTTVWNQKTLCAQMKVGAKLYTDIVVVGNDTTRIVDTGRRYTNGCYMWIAMSYIPSNRNCQIVYMEKLVRCQKCQ